MDWKSQAFALAEKLYGIEQAASWKAQVEQAAPITPITQVRVRPNPAFAAGLGKPRPVPASRQRSQPLRPRVLSQSAGGRLTMASTSKRVALYARVSTPNRTNRIPRSVAGASRIREAPRVDHRREYIDKMLRAQKTHARP